MEALRISETPPSPSTRVRRQPSRAGAAAVEFALISPLVFLFIFAGFEFSRANMLRNLCENAAFDSARQGVLPGATADKCIAAARNSLSVLNVRNATVTVAPATIVPTTPEVTVQIQIPLMDNAMPMSRFVIGTTLAREITVKREVVFPTSTSGNQ